MLDHFWYTKWYVPDPRSSPLGTALGECHTCCSQVGILYRLQSKTARVVQFYDLHHTSDFIFLGFELCLGSLAAALALDGRPPPGSLAAFRERLRWPGGRVEVLRDVAAALAEVHAERVSHNDLHAANVLVARDGTVKLHDLQLSKEVAACAAGRRFFSFTTFANAGLQINRSRRAPEILDDAPQLTDKVDIWALGVRPFLRPRPLPPLSTAAFHPRPLPGDTRTPGSSEGVAWG